MKVLQVNCVYKKGSTGKITYDLHKGLLDAGIESVVCYGRGELIREPGVYKTCPEWYSHLNKLWSMIRGIMYGGCFFSTSKLISVIKKEHPDVVHLQCINGYFVNIYHLVEWLKESHIKTVLTLHAEFMYTANCGHALECARWKTGCGSCPRRKQETKSFILDGTSWSWKKMKRAFDGFGDLIVTSVSPWLMERAKQSPILADKVHTVVYNGVNTDIFHSYDTSVIRSQLGYEKKKIVFHATPSFSTEKDHFKGGWYICELARRMPGVQFIVAGPYDENDNIPTNMILLGRITDQAKLAQYYSLADLTVIASKKETFSMVVAESLCCGTPVVGFKAGGPEQIALKEYSGFVDYGDIEDLLNTVKMFLNIKSPGIEKDAEKHYSDSNMVRQYIDLYKR